MGQERKWNLEITQLLKDQIDYLKNDIIHKNTIIESLMFKIANNNKNNESTFVHSTPSSSSDVKAVLINQKTSLSENNEFEHSTSSSSDVNDNNNYRNTSVNVEDPSDPARCTNRYQVLVNDADSDFDNEFENYVNIQVVQTKHPLNYNPEYNRSTPYVNRHPENDVLKYSHPNPGNSTYAHMTNHGKKIMILSDSICSRIKLNEFNSYVKNGSAHSKSFPSVTPKELVHYCTHSLMEDKPIDVLYIPR